MGDPELPMRQSAKTAHTKPSERYRPNGYAGGKAAVVFLYAAYCKGFAKIGITQTPKIRIRAMQSGNPFPIELLGSHPLCTKDAVIAENTAMLILDAGHWHGDWFKCTRNHALYAVATVATKFPSPDGKAIPDANPRFFRRARPVQTPDGQFKSSTEAAERYGISKQAVHARASRGERGWSFVD